MFTISEVSKNFNISTRTLRYYEQIGLISSINKENYAYRTYDDDTIKRIQQIMVLRKLRIPLKEIKVILNNKNHVDVIDILEKNMFIIDNEINSLTVIRDILKALIHRINENVKVNVNIDSLQDSDILSIVKPLSLSKIKIKEDLSVKDLNRVSESLNKLQDKDVRIIYHHHMLQVYIAQEIWQKFRAEIYYISLLRKQGCMR